MFLENDYRVNTNLIVFQTNNILGIIYYSIYFDYGKIINVVITFIFFSLESYIASYNIQNCDQMFHKLNMTAILGISMVNYYVEIQQYDKFRAFKESNENSETF